MSTNIMKSLRFTEFGPPSVLRIEETAIPELGEGDALVQVEGAAINPSDIGIVVVTKGNHAEDAEVWGGSAILGSVRGGSHAEYVVPAETLSLKPRSLSKVFSFGEREDQQGRSFSAKQTRP